MDVSFAPTNNFQQAQLALYQDDDNYIEIGHAYSSDLGGEAATLAREDGGVQTSWSPLSLSQAKVSANRMQLRLDRDLVTDKVSALYSLDGTNWLTLGQTCQALTNAQVCLWTGGFTGGLPNCDLRRLDIITSSTPLIPVLVAQPQHLVFNAVAGQAGTNLQQLRVVARRAPVSQAFTITNNASWLSASTATGNTPGSCDVSVNTTGLAAGTYQGLLTCSAPGATSAVASVTLIVNPAVRARLASWRGAKAGAMTVWVDDSQPTAFDELTADGFQGSYLLWGVTPIPVWATNYYVAGMELGGHTVDHLCLALDEPATRYELETNIASICAASPQPSSNLITFAFPCGFAPVASQVIASDYYLAVHGYNINQLEDSSPYNFMNLKTFNSHEHSPYPPADFKPLVDAAIEQGKWYNMVLHTTNNSDGAITRAVGKDIWVAPGGAVTKYILQRDRTVITNYQEAAGQISFSYYRLPLDASSARSFETAIGPQDALTFQVDTTGTNAVYSATLNGNPTPCTVKMTGGRTLMVFDTLVTTTPQTAVLQLVSNRTPSLPVQTNQAVHQLATLTVTNTAADLDAPPQVLTYSLLNPPTGAQIDANGVIQWTPTPAQNPGPYLLTTVVADNGQPPLRATNSFTVSVQLQDALQLPPASDLTANAGQAIAVTNTANYSRSVNPYATNTLSFNYANRDALLADGWSFIATTPLIGPRNTEITNAADGGVISYDQAAHPGSLRIPCDVGDLWGTLNSSRNALLRNLQTNWVSLRLGLTFPPTQNYQQVHLSLYQDDDNYLQVGFAFNSGLGGQAATLILETNATPNHFYTALYAVTNIYLRLDQDSASRNVTGLYSLDQTNWTIIGTYNQAFANPRLGIWAGGSPVPWTNGLPNVDLRRLDVVVSNYVPTVLAYTLVNPPSGTSIDNNGIIRWTPPAGLGQATNIITTVVTDNGQLPLSATNSLRVIVRGLLTLAADNQSRVYGSSNPLLTGTLTGVQNGDNITAAYATTATNGSPVGTYAIVPVMNDPGGKLTSYTAVTTNGTLTITPATLTGTADNQSRLYGQTNPPFTATFTGFVNGENSNLFTGTLSGNISAQPNSPVGAYPITVSGLSASNYVVNYLPGALSVVPTPLWVIVSNVSRPYGQANPALNAGFSGFVNSETSNALGGVLVLNTSAQTNSPVGTYPVVPGGLTSTNYALNYSNGTLTVTAHALLVSADNQSRVYGTTNPGLTGTLTGVQSGDNIIASYSTLANTNSPVGAYAIIPALADPGHRLTNYSVTVSNGLLTVGPTPLWVTASNASRLYGQANPAFTAGFSGFVNGESSNALGGVLVLTTSAQTNSPVSGYPIVPGGLTSTNYALNYSNATLTVTAYALMVGADNQSRTYGTTNARLTGTLTGVQSGDNITASYTTLANTNSPVGTYAIIPTLADPGHKLANYSVTVSNGLLTVGPTPLWVTASNASRPYGQATPALSAGFSGFVNSETSNALGGVLVFSTSAQTNSPVGTYPIVPSGLTSTNYALNYSNGTLTVNAAPLAVAADNQSRTYGAANPALTGRVTSLQNNDHITASFATTADSRSRVGVYPITVSLSDPDTRLGNYQVTTNTGTLAVVAATLTVTAENKSRAYGATNPVLSAIISGFVHGDSGTVVTGSPSLTAAATKGSNVGTYPITAALGSLGATNYLFSYVNGTVTITPAALISTADNLSRFYGQTNPLFTTTYSGFVNGENANALTGMLGGSTSAQTNSPVGVYSITVSGQSAANYAISYLPGTLTVSPSPLWITASNASRAYGQANPPFSAAFSGFVNGETTNALGGVLVFNTSAETNSPVGTYPIVPGGLTSTNYTLTCSNGTLNVTAYALMVSADNQSRTYGAANAVLTGTLTGVQNDDGITASYSTVARPSSPVGGYPIVLALADPGHKLTNYSVTLSNGTLTVVPAELTALVDNQDRLYGETNPALTGTLIGVLNQDDISVGYTTAAGPASLVGTYPISPVLSDPDNRLTNYNLTVHEGTLTVFHAWLTIKADDQSRPYGGADPVLTITVNGLKNGDDISAICWSTAGPDSPVGSYAIYAYLYDPDLKVGNYILDYEAGTLTVTRANSAITIRTSANPSSTGSNVTFTATLSAQPPGGGIPTGGVQFLADATPLGAPAPLNNGVATFTTTALAHGYRHISAQYAGDINFTGSTAALTPDQVVNTAPRGCILLLSTVKNQSASLSTSNLLANCTDAELDVLTVTAVSPSSTHGGIVSFNGLAAIYLPPTAYTGSDSFTFTVSDPYGATATGTVFVTVTAPVVSPPLINGLARQVGGSMQLRCSGSPGQTYLLQVSTALNNWSTVSTNSADASGVILFLDQQAVSYPRRFYRLAVP